MAEMSNSTIYGLEATDDPGRIRYVGRTTKPYLCSRIVGHRYDSRNGRTSPVSVWIREVLARGADIHGVVLETSAPMEAEARWIATFREQPGGLLNTRGGGKSGGAFDEAGRERLSEAGRRSYQTSNRAMKCRGEAGGNSRLKEAQVREIRAAYRAGGITQRALALRFDVDRTTVGKIISRQLWPHI